MTEKQLQRGHVCHGDGHHVRIGACDVVTLKDFDARAQRLQQRLLVRLPRRDADDGLDRQADLRKIEVGMDSA